LASAEGFPAEDLPAAVFAPYSSFFQRILNISIKLAYVPVQDEYGKNATLVTSCTVTITYGRTDMYDIISALEGKKKYEGL